MAKWIPRDNLPSSTSFICPYCRETVYFAHGSSSKSRKHGVTKRCLYQFCPWCGKRVEPMRVEGNVDDIKRITKGLQFCADDCSKDCPYFNEENCNALLSADALNALKNLLDERTLYAEWYEGYHKLTKVEGPQWE